MSAVKMCNCNRSHRRRAGQDWYCPHCPQICSRRWNMKKHIERWHNKIGEPTKDDGWHSISGTTNFIRDVTSLRNNNNYDQNQQRHPTFSLNPYLKREEESTPKKRDPLDEFIEFWRPHIQKMKEYREIIKSLQECFSPIQQQQQPYITTTTNLGQTPIIVPIILPVIMTTSTSLPPSAPSPPPPQQQQQASVPKKQEEEQKKEIINPGTNLITNLFINSTLVAEELHRRSKELGKGGGGEGSIIIPQEPSPSPY